MMLYIMIFTYADNLIMIGTESDRAGWGEVGGIKVLGKGT